MELTVVKSADGDREIQHIPSALAWALRELPKLLSEEFPQSTSRLTQDPYSGQDDRERREDWVRHCHPELRHLFESARDLVLEDLEGLKRERLLPPLFHLTIPGPNVNAWLSAIAAARVGLGHVHEVKPKEME